MYVQVVSRWGTGVFTDWGLQQGRHLCSGLSCLADQFSMLNMWACQINILLDFLGCHEGLYCSSERAEAWRSGWNVLMFESFHQFQLWPDLGRERGELPTRDDLGAGCWNPHQTDTSPGEQSDKTDIQTDTPAGTYQCFKGKHLLTHLYSARWMWSPTSWLSRRQTTWAAIGRRSRSRGRAPTRSLLPCLTCPSSLACL